MSRCLAAVVALVALGLTVFPPPGRAAEAVDWRVERDDSRLEFVAEQAGARFRGRFERWDATIRFSPDALGDSRFEVRIELASARTGEGERDETLRDDAFFAVERHPSAVYDATGFERLDENRYRADGRLMLKGETRAVPITFRFTPTDEGSARLEGRGELSRLAFDVGTGEWRDTKWIGENVAVEFALSLAQVAKTD